MILNFKNSALNDILLAIILIFSLSAFVFMVVGLRDFNFGFNIFSREKITIKENDWEIIKINNINLICRYYHLSSLFIKAFLAILGVVLYENPETILIIYIILSSFSFCAYVYIN